MRFALRIDGFRCPCTRVENNVGAVLTQGPVIVHGQQPHVPLSQRLMVWRPKAVAVHHHPIGSSLSGHSSTALHILLTAHISSQPNNFAAFVLKALFKSWHHRGGSERHPPA